MSSTTENKHHTDTTIETRGGRVFHYFGDDLAEINIHDIAASLSKMCRFVGHCRDFYSVAEHSVYVSHLVPQEMALAGLLHDASEAYLSDMASPIKKQMPEYKQIEHVIMGKIAKRFDLPKLFWELTEIKKADMDMLKTEAFYMFDSQGEGWGIPEHVELQEEMEPQYYIHYDAYDMFMQRYEELTNA
jgi:5'-deoxynucleotidase YfbR-like HD superfamily hydrolase